MAEFCKQCSIEMFGKDFGDLKGLSTEQHDKDELYCCVICEGCGHIQVDSNGACISENCLKNHKKG